MRSVHRVQLKQMRLKYATQAGEIAQIVATQNIHIER